MTHLSLKRAPFDPNREDYNALEDGVIVGCIFISSAAPYDRPWMWATGHNGDIHRRGTRLRADARGRPGRVQAKLAPRGMMGHAGAQKATRLRLAWSTIAPTPTLIFRCPSSSFAPTRAAKWSSALRSPRHDSKRWSPSNAVTPSVTKPFRRLPLGAPSFPHRGPCLAKSRHRSNEASADERVAVYHSFGGERVPCVTDDERGPDELNRCTAQRRGYQPGC
jgi:hypothetical protein